ncbi:hypothetical protein [Streptomyces sp. NPDC101149]|uniref:hypothetical protein n=1 Tax=Streptomyces sp. NPDC101149 TaxID=3366113 RepID=UPI0037F3DC3A
MAFVVSRSQPPSPSPGSRDRSLRPFKCAQAGIPHYWRIEEEGGLPVIHTYELDETTRAYVATGIHRDRMKTAVPFGIDIDLIRLVR